MLLSSALSHLDDAIAKVDIAGVAGSDASRVLKSAVATQRRLAALTEQLADRCEATHVPETEGFSSAVDWRARVMGTSEKTARRKRRTRKNLGKKSPKAADALNKGTISEEQAEALSGADDPDELFDEDGFTEKTVEDIEAEARLQSMRNAKNEAEVAARRKRLRSCRRWTDADGMRKTLLTLTPEDEAEFHAKHEGFLRKRLRDDSGDTFEQKSADAFMDLVRSTGGAIKRVVNIHASYESVMRGWVEEDERCEIPGIGDVPVSLVREWTNDCLLRLLVSEKNRLLWCSETRLPERVKDGVKAFGWHRCARCHKVRDLEVDHKLAETNGGSDELINLQPLCEACHDMKTRKDAPWTAEKIYGQKLFDTG